MKYLLFLFVLLFVVSACDSSDQFTSIADSAIEGQQASQIPEYQEKLRSIVNSDVKLKIGGKKRKTINVAETKNQASPAPSNDSTIPQSQKEKIVVLSEKNAAKVVLSQFSCKVRILSAKHSDAPEGYWVGFREITSGNYRGIFVKRNTTSFITPCPKPEECSWRDLSLECTLDRP